MVGMVISILNQKGGAGKTTLAIHIAMALAQEEQASGRTRVLVVDADQQGSALDWSGSRSNAAGEGSASPDDLSFPVIGLPKASLHRELPKLVKDYDHIVIDGPPRVYDVTRSAILASDLVLIPVQPSPYDVWAAKEIVDLVREASSFNENLKCAFVINRKIVNTAIGRDVSEALGGYELPILKAHISQRVGFAESAGQGQTVLETAPTSAASDEIRALVRELKEFAQTSNSSKLKEIAS
jgi:chromosome partitioning protein